MNNISGQRLLPLDKESENAPAVRLSVKHEAFCLEFAKTGNATKAYAKVYPDSSSDAARRNSSRLMTNDNIKARNAELKRAIRVECEALLMDFYKSTLLFDPASCLTIRGERKEIKDIDEDHRKLMGLETKVIDGSTRYLPTFPTTSDKHRSADSLAKIMAMNTDQLKVDDVRTESLTDLERATRIERLLAVARTRRDAALAAGSVGSVAGAAEPGA